MRIVLRADVANVGKRGEIIDVADGHARNYLLPKGLAMKATDGVQTQAAAMRRSRDVKDARDREAAETVARTLVPAVIRIPAKAGPEGKLFGSVTAADVVDAVKAAGGPLLDRRRIEIGSPIKTIGSHQVAVRLHPEVLATIDVEVVQAK